MPSQGTEATPSYRWIVLFITSIAFFMSPFDASVVNLALPAMSSSLRVSLTSLIWVPTAYLLVIASLETTIGRIGDVRGKRNLFVVALCLFSMGSLFASLCENLSQLILARVIQGLGAAGMDACGIALLASAFPMGRRGRAYGINQMTIYIGLTSGPIIGGILVQAFGWRSIFYVNVPIGFPFQRSFILFIPRASTQKSS